MLLEKFKHFELNKIALKGSGFSFSYAQVLEIIKSRAGFFQKRNETFLLCHTLEIENLLNFLAIMAAGKKAVMGGKSLDFNQKDSFSKQHNLKIIDFVPVSEQRTEDFEKPKPSDLFLGVLSSGTSGQSKLIWKDYQAWFSAFPHQSTIFGLNQEDNVFVLDALAYSANLNTILHALWLGLSVFLGKISEASKWQEEMVKNDISSVFLVPSHIRLLMANHSAEIPRLKSLVSAGEKLDAKLAQSILIKFEGVLLTEYYGAAELGHISYIQNQDIINHPTSVGKAFPEVEIKLKENKIWVESPYVSPNYRANATVSDFGEIDTDGFLYVLGREGRMFNRRGLNIFAEEIENSALLHPFVLEAVAISSPNREHSIDLIVVKKEPISKSELRDFLIKKLPQNKLPNRILFKESLPRNPSGKIDIKALSKRPVEEEIFA
ncbi:long-chain fatty acid--CoA ligase [Lacihabitans sp. LS3-19]|uniref:AMP-binding protein n=1 Tax=Lacihabitans sp. LS3-19 TaxID=2487335 RepID=UPI0020CFCBA9|nr:AMP-binding protein [Lacihabitans sp. LS3-19]MCP9770018.1 long-chain fatty acid--CoA ligase [Lacihabitans sp. LS3-19]